MKLTPATCFIQEGAFGAAKIKQLEKTLAGLYRQHFGADQRLICLWFSLPYERAFLAGELSNASTVQIPVADGLAAAERHAFMADVCAEWQALTGCSKDEIILVSPDRSVFKQAQATMMSRYGEVHRGKAKRRMFSALVLGRLRKGYLSAPASV